MESPPLTSHTSFDTFKQENDPIAQLPTSEMRTEAQSLFMQELGFSLIVRYIMESKKPLIGHNMIYDMGFLFNQFVGPLPNTFKEWAEEVETSFPQIYDTKVLSLEAGDYGKTELGQLF